MTDKLIPLLNDTSKGIVVQFILAAIWNYDLQKAGWKTGSYIQYIENKKDTTNEIYFSGLKFYQDDSSGIYARQEELNRNKKEWLNFIGTKSDR